jgi:hypothetical protein
VRWVLVVVVVVLAAAANQSIDRAVTGAFNVVVWIALIAGGYWLWTKIQAATQEKSREAVQDEVTAWRTAGDEAQQRRLRRPSPARSPTLAMATEHIGAGLPDSGLARRAISEVAAGLARCTADEAREHADAVRPPVARLCQSGRFRERNGSGWGPSHEGVRLTREALDLVDDIFAWANARRALLADVHPDAALLLADIVNPLTHTLDGFRRNDHTKVGDGAGVPVLQPGRWETFLGDVHSALTTIADELAALPPPALLPTLHPPGFARLKDHVVAETVTDQLVTFIDQAAELREAALAGAWPGPFDSDWSLGGHLLDGFLTTEVRGRFEKATTGFNSVARWSATDIAPDSHSQIYLAYVVIALNYLTEVREQMAKYTRDSGQGPHGDPITVHGNVGAINSEINNSNLAVASTLHSIGTTVAAVADRGDTRIADAINALTNAVQQDPELAEDDRTELLHHVAEIAEAAAEPGEDRQRSRAKAALAAITTAAKGAAQLAQTVNTWHDVLGKLF